MGKECCHVSVLIVRSDRGTYMVQKVLQHSSRGWHSEEKKKAWGWGGGEVVIN